MSDPRLESTFDNSDTGKVNAAGNLTITIKPKEPVNWILTQVSIEMFTAPAGAVCVMRKNGAFVTFLVETGDAAGGDPPVVIRPGESVTIEWTGCTPNDIGRVFYIYDKVVIWR